MNKLDMDFNHKNNICWCWYSKKTLTAKIKILKINKNHLHIHKEGKEFWAQCIELPGIFTRAKSLTELRKNMKEALDLHLVD